MKIGLKWRRPVADKTREEEEEMETPLCLIKSDKRVPALKPYLFN